MIRRPLPCGWRGWSVTRVRREGLRIGERLRELSAVIPDPRISQIIARGYDLAGEKDKAEDAYGRAFMQDRVDSLASDLAAYVDYWVEKKENLESATAMAVTAPGSSRATRFMSDVSPMLIVRPAGSRALEAYGPAWLETNGASLSAQDIGVMRPSGCGRE